MAKTKLLFDRVVEYELEKRHMDEQYWYDLHTNKQNDVVDKIIKTAFTHV